MTNPFFFLYLSTVVWGEIIPPSSSSRHRLWPATHPGHPRVLGKLFKTSGALVVAVAIGRESGVPRGRTQDPPKTHRLAEVRGPGRVPDCRL